MSTSLINIVYNMMNTKTLSDCQKVDVKNIIMNNISVLEENIDYFIEKTEHYMNISIDLESLNANVHLLLYTAMTSELI
jgi:hypothetical protein